MDLIFLGRQGSGKGTQARILAERFGYTIVEMGQECRRLAAEDSTLGRETKALVEAGKLIPLPVVTELTARFLATVRPGQAIIFDGMPRRLDHAVTFWPMLEKLGRDYRLVYFGLAEATAIYRLGHRLTCPRLSCGAVYAPDYQSAACAACGTKLERRVDDNNLASVKMRLAVFDQDTLPVVEQQRVLGKVIEVDAGQEVAPVTTNLLKALVEQGAIPGVA